MSNEDEKFLKAKDIYNNEKKKKLNLQGKYLAIGVALGVVYGMLFDNIGLGIGICVAIGLALDLYETRKKNR